jgi:RNA polymerase sigma-70 factor (ECF subfamily)
MVPTAANGQPAFAVYLRLHDGTYRAYVMQVLTCTAAGVARIVVFRDPGQFATFGLPEELPPCRHDEHEDVRDDAGL